jgi:hypothetical protein
MPSGINDVIAQLEKQKSAIERALQALRDVDGSADPAPVATRRGRPPLNSAGDRRKQPELPGKLKAGFHRTNAS